LVILRALVSIWPDAAKRGAPPGSGGDLKDLFAKAVEVFARDVNLEQLREVRDGEELSRGSPAVLGNERCCSDGHGGGIQLPALDELFRSGIIGLELRGPAAQRVGLESHPAAIGERYFVGIAGGVLKVAGCDFAKRIGALNGKDAIGIVDDH
jgi:hypothetical protein